MSFCLIIPLTSSRFPLFPAFPNCQKMTFKEIIKNHQHSRKECDMTRFEFTAPDAYHPASSRRPPRFGSSIVKAMQIRCLIALRAIRLAGVAILRSRAPVVVLAEASAPCQQNCTVAEIAVQLPAVLAKVTHISTSCHGGKRNLDSLRQDRRAWWDGYVSGADDFVFEGYSLGSTERWSWWSGIIKGRAARINETGARPRAPSLGRPNGIRQTPKPRPIVHTRCHRG